MTTTIKRDFYLNRLIHAKGDGFVKIVTGLRRCGKSFLLFNLFKSHLLKEGVRRENIVEVALDRKKDARLRNPDAMYEFLKTKTAKRRGTIYVFLDEIQECKRPRTAGRESAEAKTEREQEFYDILNEFRDQQNVDLYVTGSNSRLLVTDVATQFRGRGETIQVNPLTFSEYYEAVGGDKSDAWSDYLLYGGMPELLHLKTDEAKKSYLDGLFKTIYFKDIVERNALPDELFLSNVNDVLMSSAGSLTNPTKLANHIASATGRKPDPRTVGRYIDLLMDAYLFRKAERYDIKGRSYLESPSKYYPADLGLRNARLNFRQVEPDHLMECAIYTELVARGANVDVGMLEIETRAGGIRERKRLEIDFVVNLRHEKVYIQSACRLPDDAKREQETRGLRKIGDSFRKLVVVDGIQPFYTDETGISYVGLMEFLLNPTLLSL
ncbi:MAG: ATP-binding protein [Kiritimatiellae bacterium]|nr:ATP-binding protein [Kiritimatiellia bacterium]